MRRPLKMLLIAATILLLPLAAQGQEALQLNQITSGMASDGSPAIYTFNAETPGVLTVVVRGASETDLQIMVADSVGQTVPNGQVDMDVDGDVGAEQLAVVLRSPGDYQVRVGTWYGSGNFEVVASWISYPTLGGPADPDGLPTQAAELVPGSPIDDTITPGDGDMWDWFKVTATDGGVITVLTEAAEGDLALEVYEEGNWAEPVNRSDQDMQGVTGNESITVQAQAGQTYYFKVAPVFGGDPISYRIRAGIM